MPKDSRSNRTSFEGQDHRVCAERGVEHRLAKPYHPWTNGLAERMVRTIKDATVRAFHYAAIDDLRRHVRDWLLAYNYAKQLKALRFRTPLEALKAVSAEKPELFVRPLKPRHAGTKHLSGAPRFG